MDVSRRTPARPLAFIAALLLVVLSMGVTGTALADPGNGNGGGQGNGNGQAQSEANGNGGGGSQATPPASTGTAAQQSDTPKAGNSSSTNNGQAKKAGSESTGSTSSSDKPGKSSTSNGSSDHSKGNASTQGDYSKPQPQSNADQNSGGANGKCPDGPYCSTRDGSPSLNGNGKGKATGKPCAGCVGKADNKNPHGQYPNGSDHNAGYECDRNHGIGRTNPAHTGCVKTPPPPKCVPKQGEDEHCHPIPPGCKPKPGEDEHCQPDSAGVQAEAG